MSFVGDRTPKDSRHITLLATSCRSFASDPRSIQTDQPVTVASRSLDSDIGG